jgi:CubicO group peptidase (beta-lactamase class C family)
VISSKLVATLVLASLAACAGPTPPDPSPPADQWHELDEALRAFVPARLPGLGFLLTRSGETLYAVALGNQTLDSVLPIASSTKMPSGTVILSLVDEGRIDLDEPVATCLAGSLRWPRDKSAITMRMLFNHTSGLVPDPPCLSQQGLTLAECAQQVADQPLEFAPGTAFAYGGGSMQLAGYVAEVVTGKDWNALFAERVAGPLSLGRFSYGDALNPRLAGGASSDLGDYNRIQQMVLADGRFAGRQILSRAAIELWRTDQVAGVPKLRSPGDDRLPGYSFGWWISSPALHPGSRGPELSDQGAFGCTPWIDFDLGYAATLLIRDRTQTGTEIWDAVRPIIIENLRR